MSRRNKQHCFDSSPPSFSMERQVRKVDLESAIDLDMYHASTRGTQEAKRIRELELQYRRDHSFERRTSDSRQKYQHDDARSDQGEYEIYGFDYMYNSNESSYLRDSNDSRHEELRDISPEPGLILSSEESPARYCPSPYSAFYLRSKSPHFSRSPSKSPIHKSPIQKEVRNLRSRSFEKQDRRRGHHRDSSALSNVSRRKAKSHRHHSSKRSLPSNKNDSSPGAKEQTTRDHFSTKSNQHHHRRHPVSRRFWSRPSRSNSPTKYSCSNFVSRSKSKTRTRSRSKSRSNSESSENSSSRSKSRSHVDNLHHRQNSLIANSTNDEPSCCILLRNLPPGAKEDDLAVTLRDHKMREIRVLRNRDTGKLLGMSYIEFSHLHDAKNWFNENKDSYYILGQRVYLSYTRSLVKGHEWICSKCNASNYSNRLVCVVCNSCKDEYEDLCGDSRPKELAPASNVIILRGLLPTSSDTAIRDALCHVTTHPVLELRLIRDKISKVSRGFCFVDFENVSTATEVLDQIFSQEPAFFVEGRRVKANFARGNNIVPAKSISQVAASAISQGGWSAAPENVQSQSDKDHSRAVYSSEPQKYFSNPPSMSNDTTSPSTFLYDSTSGFYYDTASGLYFDPLSQFYYNPHTQKYCYYDTSKGAYVDIESPSTTCVDSTTENTDSSITNSNHLIVDSKSGVTNYTTNNATVTNTNNNEISYNVKTDNKNTDFAEVDGSTKIDIQNSDFSKEKKKKDVELVFHNSKQARKIAKDMERWAQKLNQTKAGKSSEVLYPQHDTTIQPQTETLKGDFVINPITLTLDNAASMRITPVYNLNDKIGGLDNTPYLGQSVRNATLPDSYADYTRLICTLCKRQFVSTDLLSKHIELSQLHRENLEKVK